MVFNENEDVNPFAGVILNDEENKNNEDEIEEGEDDEEGGDEKVELPKKELERLQNTEKSYKESQKEMQILGWKDKIVADPKEFIKLYNSDKKMAAEVAKRFGEKRDPSEIVKQLKGTASDDSKGVSKEELLAEVEHKQAMKTFHRIVTELEIDPESKKGKAFMEEFEEQVGDKMLDEDSMRRYLRKALKLSNIPYEEGKRKADKSYDAGGFISGRPNGSGKDADQEPSMFDQLGKEGTKDRYPDAKKK